jgi:hypothetical protein
MKDTRTVLDAVRTKIPGDAKLLVLWRNKDGGFMHASQANMSQADLSEFATTMMAQTTSENLPKPRIDKG